MSNSLYQQEREKVPIQELYQELESSCVSSALAVMDHLQTVASNGGDQAKAEYLQVEANELATWALLVARRIKV